MVMTVKRPKSAAGFTLIETIISIVVLMIIVLGTSAFRLTAALGARKADLRIAATRTALLLYESWRGVSDPNTFEPTQLANDVPDLAIEASDEGPVVPAGFTALGSYRIVVDGVNYYATLSWKDISPGLRALSIVVAWERRGSNAGGFEEADKSFKLTTYVAN